MKAKTGFWGMAARPRVLFEAADEWSGVDYRLDFTVFVGQIKSWQQLHFRFRQTHVRGLIANEQLIANVAEA